MAISRILSRTQLGALNQLRHRYLTVIAVIAIVAAIVGVIPVIVAWGSRGDINALGRWIFGDSVFIVVAGLVLFLVRRNRFGLATALMIGALVVLTIATTNSAAFMVIALLTVISTATLANTLFFIATNTIVIGVAIIATANGLQLNADTEAFRQLGEIAGLIIASISTRIFINAADTATADSGRNANLLQASAEIGQVMTRVLSLDELLPRAVNLIRDRFAFYHVQVFLLDETKTQARLVASTGEVGEKLLSRKHSLPVGSRSVIGRVTQTGEPAIARDTDSDVVHLRNELLPNTRAELALPIMDGDNIIGALDVQSARPNAFTPTDIQALQVMSNQLATAILNAQLFERQAKNVQENKRLFLEAETNLREIQRLNQQLTQQAWLDYLKVRSDTIGVTLDQSELIPQADWSETMREAARRRRAIVSEDDKKVIAMPIMLRGQSLGVVEIEMNESAQPGDTLDMVQAVTQRLAIALDNARLFEEAQQTTAQEQWINDIVSHYQSASSVNEVLQITLTELSQTLGAKRSSIRLGNFDLDGPRKNGGSAS